MLRSPPRCLPGAVALTATLFAWSAAAQEKEAPSLTFGAGVGATNDYEGSDEFQAVPLVSFEYVGRRFSVKSRGIGLEADVIPSPKLQFGPIVSYRFGRDEDVDDRAVAALPEVDDSLEVGMYAATGVPMTALGIEDPGVVFARGSFVHDILDGHDGFLISGSVGVTRPLAEDLKGVLSVSTNYASDAYMNAYFDVTPAGAAASGLSRFDADGGFKDVGVSAVLSYAFTDSWSLSVIGAYTRLLGDAASSPVTADAGSRDQFFGGLSINYRAF